MHIHGTPIRVGTRGPKRKSLADRFELMVERREGCWGWTGFLSANGYGWISVGGRNAPDIGAHCAAWILRRGPIPDGMQINHVCDNPPCTRNDDDGIYVVDGVEYERVGHLWLGTTKANARDMVQKGRQAALTHPERLAYGDRNGSRTHPERLARGDRSGARLHPERLQWGDRNWTRQRPDDVFRGEAHSEAKLTEAQVVSILDRLFRREATQRALAREYGVSKSLISAIGCGSAWAHIPRPGN